MDKFFLRALGGGEVLWLIAGEYWQISLGVVVALVILLQIVKSIVWALIATRLGDKFDEVEIGRNRILAKRKAKKPLTKAGKS